MAPPKGSKRAPVVLPDNIVPTFAAPPKITRSGRTSPYVPADLLSPVAAMVAEGPARLAQDLDAWVCPLPALPKETNARIAANSWRKAIAGELDKPVDAFAVRVYPENGGGPDGPHMFAIALKKGA